MRHILSVFLLLVLFAVECGAQKPVPSNQLPMYGGIEKNEAQKKADENLVAALKAQGATPEQGAERVLKLAWEAFHKKDLGLATQRFNQGWMLDPENSDSYHGFALVESERGAPANEVEKYFQMAFAKSKVQINTYVDYGRFLWKQDRYQESLVPLQKALSIDSKAWRARLWTSLAYYKLGDYTQACEWARKAEENKDDLEPGYLEAMCAQAKK